MKIMQKWHITVRPYQKVTTNSLLSFPKNECGIIGSRTMIFVAEYYTEQKTNHGLMANVLTAAAI